MNALIRLLYSLVIAGAVVAFVGFGINSMYQPPKNPSSPNYSSTDESTAQTQQDNYFQAVDKYNQQNKKYQRKATYTALPLAVVFLLMGLYVYKSSDVIGEGLGLGGAGVSIYAIATASIAEARSLRFLAVTILLVSILLIAYRRFYLKPIRKV